VIDGKKKNDDKVQFINRVNSDITPMKNRLNSKRAGFDDEDEKLDELDNLMKTLHKKNDGSCPGSQAKDSDLE
jgi:hypothetical protein